MSTLRKAPVLAAAAAVGLLVVGTTVIAVYIRNKENRTSSAKARSPEDNTEPASDSSSPDKDRSVVMDEIQVPLSIAPASTGSKALVVCADGSEEASTAAGWASASRGAGAAVSVCPPSFLESHANGSAGTYDSVIVEGGGKEEAGVSGSVLGEVLKLLKAGGKVNVAIAGAGATISNSKRTLTFAGFVNVVQSSQDERVLVGERAAWEAGASAPVRLSFAQKPKVEVPTAATSASNGSSRSGGSGSAANSGSNGAGGGANGGGPVKTWKLALDDDDNDDGGGVFGAGAGGDDDDDDDDLVDEDALLENSAPVKRATESDAGGCATKRRACKDCSCGRAEMDEAESNGAPRPVVSVGDVDDALTSACGNCSKGDAFRCGGCPFLGKPAFEKGQEKTIMLSDLDSQQDA